MSDAHVPSLDRLLPPEETTVGYLLRLSRPRFWLYLAGPVLVGVAYGADTVGELFTPLSIGLLLYFLLPANVYLYGINDIFDADIDQYNPKKADQEVRYEGGPVVIGVVFLSGALGLVFVPFVGVGAGALGLYYLLATEYSAPPLRFKTTPLLDSVSNGLYALPGVVAFTAVSGAYPPAGAVAGGWLWTMAMHTFSAIPDIEPDREAGIRTTATLLGEERTYAYCAVVWALAAAAFALVHPLFGAVLAVYPVLVVGIALSSVAVDRAYWWYPAINTVVGAVLTMAAVWRLTYGA